MPHMDSASVCSWLKLRHLVLIETLARTQNMRMAAEEMNLTQPALSKMLRDIEAFMGMVLFDREPRRMVPTDLGRHVADYASATLNDTEKFVARLNALRTGGHGYLKVGAIFAATFSVLPRALQQVKSLRPLLSIEIVEQTSDKLLGMLERKEIDLVIGRFNDSHHAHIFDFFPLARETFVLVSHVRHPLAEATTLTVDALRNSPWVLYPTGTPIRDRIDRAFAAAGARAPQNTIETTSMPTFLQLLDSQQPIAALPLSMVARQLRKGRFKALQSDLKIEPLTYGVITRKGETLNATARLFADTLREQNPPDLQTS